MTEFYEEHESVESYYAALQSRINDGTIWILEGSAGRAAMDAIRGGNCVLGPRGHQNYWGSPIPGRDEVKKGTLGSIEYAANINGQEYVDMLLSQEAES